VLLHLQRIHQHHVPKEGRAHRHPVAVVGAAQRELGDAAVVFVLVMVATSDQPKRHAKESAVVGGGGRRRSQQLGEAHVRAPALRQHLAANVVDLDRPHRRTAVPDAHVHWPRHLGLGQHALR